MADTPIPPGFLDAIMQKKGRASGGGSSNPLAGLLGGGGEAEPPREIPKATGTGAVSTTGEINPDIVMAIVRSLGK